MRNKSKSNNTCKKYLKTKVSTLAGVPTSRHRPDRSYQTPQTCEFFNLKLFPRQFCRFQEFFFNDYSAKPFQVVKLKGPRASGVYKCEISVERTFLTRHISHNVSLISICIFCICIFSICIFLYLHILYLQILYLYICKIGVDITFSQAISVQMFKWLLHCQQTKLKIQIFRSQWFCI